MDMLRMQSEIRGVRAGNNRHPCPEKDGYSKKWAVPVQRTVWVWVWVRIPLGYCCLHTLGVSKIFPKKKNPRYRSSTHWVHVRYRLGLNDAKWQHFDLKIKTLTSLDYLTLSLSLTHTHTHTHPHSDREEARWCAPILTFGNGKSLGCFNLDFWQRRMALVWFLCLVMGFSVCLWVNGDYCYFSFWYLCIGWQVMEVIETWTLGVTIIKKFTRVSVLGSRPIYWKFPLWGEEDVLKWQLNNEHMLNNIWKIYCTLKTI